MIANFRSIRVFPLVAAASILLLFYLSVKRPYLFDQFNLIALMAIVITGLIASQYETHFWMVMIAVFFWAGSEFPLAVAMNVFRWVVLGSGAFLALAYYVQKKNRIPFNYLHLLGLFTVVAAFASALVSVNPLLTLLKALSLAALFLYGSMGARIFWSRDPEVFVRKLVLMAEGLVYFTAICYLASFEVWGNPNSLGLIMGCICWPTLLWRFITPTARRKSPRLIIALLVCGTLLVFSVSRASLVAAAVTSMFLLVGARRYRMLMIGTSLFMLILLNMYLVTPERFQNTSRTLLYKTGKQGDIMESRQKPWERSIATFQEHPWLGVGFGAADNSSDWRFTYATQGNLTRERGSSYLTMLETTGLVGAVFIALLIFALVREIWIVFSWLRRTGKVNQPAVVAASIIAAGLVNAVFEDWMFAVGYYMSVFFWLLAFSLRDLMACPAWSEEQPATERLGRAVVPGSFALRGQ
jgi:O-antigen ligase